jgi:hypothetical protein
MIGATSSAPSLAVVINITRPRKSSNAIQGLESSSRSARTKGQRRDPQATKNQDKPSDKVIF